MSLQDILKRLLLKICFGASLMCLSRFVAFCVIFNDKCCDKIVTHIIDNGQTWQTGPNENILELEVFLWLAATKMGC